MGALFRSSSLIFRHCLPSQTPSSSLNLLLRPALPISFQSNPLHTFFRSLSSLSPNNCLPPSSSITQIAEPCKEAESEVVLDSTEKYQELVAKSPILSTKEKKGLASYANSLGKKLKTRQVGKSGVTDYVVTAVVETLEANELLKVKILNNSPVKLDDAVKQLEGATGSVVVHRIGRTVILYKPSLTKLKAEEKKVQEGEFSCENNRIKAQAIGKSEAQMLEQSVAHQGRRSSSAPF